MDFYLHRTTKKNNFLHALSVAALAKRIEHFKRNNSSLYGTSDWRMAQPDIKHDAPLLHSFAQNPSQ